MNSTDYHRKDCGRMATHSGSRKNQLHNRRDAQPNHLQKFKDSVTSDKASVDVNNLTQLHRESISGAGVPEIVVSSPVVTPVPTFTFDVCCEDGIQLFVDLNSSPSNWIESLKSGVHINDVVHKPKSQSFHEDIGLLCCPKQKNGSATIGSSKETDNGHLQDGSYPTTLLTGNLATTGAPDEGEGPLSSPGLKFLSNAGHSPGNVIDEQGYFTSRLESVTERQLPGAKSSRREGIFAADPDVYAAVQTRNHFKITGNSVPSDPKCSWMPAHQGSDAGNGICEIPLFQQTNCSVDPVVKCNESSTTVRMEMKGSTVATMSQDIEHSPTGIGRCVNVVDRLKNNEVVLSRTVKSIQAPSNELQMWPVQAVDQSTCVSPVLNSISSYLADSRSEVETHSRRRFFRKSDRNIKETQSYSAGNHSKGGYVSPCHRYESQNVINHTKGIETETAGFLRKQGAGIETDAALYPCHIDGSLELVVPRKNGVDHCITTKSNELQEDICRNPYTANVGNLSSLQDFLIFLDSSFCLLSKE
ncbi:uncharacterized protein [Spinacia oleracea]|uniref:Uncharacterized protein isoform X2 n=1 Tax=Spinacia oleracea TaxID=3562 RepID=A0ABM3QU23_SPIOL|nr:uncharacterized protein LOC110794864 isoform X2 [Spinacia oleracea]